MKDLIRRIAQELVDDPEQVSVKEVKGNEATVLELRVAKEDMGRVIGKRGRNAEAMRIILNAAAKKLRKRVILEIVE